MKHIKTNFLYRFLFILLVIVLLPLISFASGSGNVPSIGPIRVEFIIFALTLVGVALFHNKTMYVALTGLTLVLVFKLIFDTEFHLAGHVFGNEHHEGEWRTLVNLLGLLFGFAILAKHFEESKIPEILPKYLPDDWRGGLLLLFIIMILSSFLDNIAAAMIGGTIAMVVFKGNVHVGFLAAIVAASNAGGAGSVVGDTTTTLMWIDGVDPVDVLKAFVGSIAGFFIFAIIGAKQQDAHFRIVKDAVEGIKINYIKLVVVSFILVGAIATNYFMDFPAVGVWVAIIVGALLTKTPWSELKHAWQGTIFLMSLVMCASMMPVQDLPPASVYTAFTLGFVSAVFDNIPLTKLCLTQGGYDWGILAYSVGFGGSMIWFGSSAGVALSNMYPQARNSVQYLKKGWHVILAYIISFWIMVMIVGWHPHAPHKEKKEIIPTEQTSTEHQP